MAASSLVQTWRSGQNISSVVLSAVCASGGSFTAVQLNQSIDGFLTRMSIIPSTSATANGLSITLKDEYGVDVLQSLGVAVSATANTDVPIMMSSTKTPPVISPFNVLTLAITGNTNTAAALTIILYYSSRL